MEYKHLVEDIKHNTKRWNSKKAIYFKNNSLNSWEGISWTDFTGQVEKLSKALLKFGVTEQQNVGIFAENMPEWIIADVGILGIRAVTVPIYATSSVKEVSYIVNDAELAILFIGNQDGFDRAQEVCKSSQYLKLIISLNKDVEIGLNKNSVYLSDFIETETDDSIHTELEKRHSECDFDDIASIIYTSGTTGEPKGVMLDHNNFAASLKAHDNELNVTENDVSLSFLPLTHIYERSWVFFCLHNGIAVYFNQDPKQIAEVLKEVRPTIMCTVPRVFEKIYGAIQAKRKEASFTKAKLMDWALKVGHRYYNDYKRLEKKIPAGIKLKHKIADRLVLSKLRDVFGGRIKFMPCGGAPLSGDMVAYFHSFGLNIKCGYGLTETTATVSLFGDTLFDFNSAGEAMNGVQIKIGENDEILVKSPGVMRGYYKKPEETTRVFKDGWFCTGDAGKIDAEGNLTITDRIKDLMKTSGGKYIAPQKLETALVNDSFIEQIAVIGDRQKYVTALTVPSFDAIKKYALEHKISFKDIEDLISNNKIKELFEKRFEELQKEFSLFEKIKKFTLLPKEFTIETGEITATLKLKRKVIQEKYKELIEKMYLEEAI